MFGQVRQFYRTVKFVMDGGCQSFLSHQWKCSERFSLMFTERHGIPYFTWAPCPHSFEKKNTGVIFYGFGISTCCPLVKCESLFAQPNTKTVICQYFVIIYLKILLNDVYLKSEKGIGVISMALCKTAVSPLPTHWRYCSLALRHRYISLCLAFVAVLPRPPWLCYHYNDVIMGAIASQITSLTIVYSIVYSDADQRKHQSSASLAFVRGIHRGPVNSPHKWPVTRKMFPFDDVIMC